MSKCLWVTTGSEMLLDFLIHRPAGAAYYIVANYIVASQLTYNVGPAGLSMALIPLFCLDGLVCSSAHSTAKLVTG